MAVYYQNIKSNRMSYQTYNKEISLLRKTYKKLPASRSKGFLGVLGVRQSTQNPV